MKRKEVRKMKKPKKKTIKVKSMKLLDDGTINLESEELVKLLKEEKLDELSEGYQNIVSIQIEPGVD